MTAEGQAPTHGGPVSARGVSRFAWSGAITAVVLVATSVALFVQGAGRLEDFGGPDALAAVAYSVVGALVVSRRPGNRIGWLFCVVGPFSALYAFAEQYARYSLVTRPGSLPGGGWAAWLAAWTWVPSAFVGLVLLPLLFPDGRLPSARWRPAAWFALAALGILLISTSLGPVQEITSLPATNPLVGGDGLGADLNATLELLVQVSFLGAALVALVVLAVRFRRSRGDQRQQLKWFLSGAALAVLAAFGPAVGPTDAALVVRTVLTSIPIPVAVGIAILRYRLYDIDRLINRTLVYGLLTAVLGLGYAAGLLLFVLVAGAGSNPPSWLVAATTLAAAAAFRPVRRRIQATVDRRFNRHRHDATRTVQAFGARLREQVELDTLSAELLAVVNQTMEPARLSLWLRPHVERPTAAHR